MEQQQIKEILEKYNPMLLGIPGVVGTAIGDCDDELCIKVLVKEYSEALELKIPRSLEGYPIEIEEVGEIKAF